MAQMSGQLAGNPDLELLRDTFVELLADASNYAAGQFKAHQGLTLSEVLPRFHEHLEGARVYAVLGQYHRSQMPVIEEEDIEDLKAFFLANSISYCEQCTITPEEARPTQCQIYVDKAVEGTAKFGLEGTMKFLQSNHLVIDRDGMIIDGHHRWLSAYLIDPKMELPAFRAKVPLKSLLGLTLDFSDKRHARNM